MTAAVAPPTSRPVPVRAETAVPRIIGDRYLLQRRLGRGGMADVYLATDRVLEREVAIKLMRQRPGQVTNADRFHREAVTLASVRSNHVVALLDARVDSDGVYLVMEYIEGRSLHQLLLEHGSLPVDRAVTIATQVLDGLAVLHGSRFVHRDVKPANILVDNAGRTVLVDLGLVFDPRRPSLTPFDATAGTVSYMAPEQRTASIVDARTDIYQLALVLLYAVTGVDPSSFGGFPDAHVPAALRLVPAPLSSVLERALSAQAAQRFASAADMKRALHDAVHRMSVAIAIGELVPPPAEPSPAAPATPWLRPLRVTLVAATTVALGLGLATLVSEPTRTVAGRGSVPSSRAPLAAAEPTAVEPAAAPSAPHIIETAVVVPIGADRDEPVSPASPPVTFASADPLLLAGLDHEIAGNHLAARTAYRDYLSRHPDGIDAAAARHRLDALR